MSDQKKKKPPKNHPWYQPFSAKRAMDNRAEKKEKLRKELER